MKPDKFIDAMGHIKEEYIDEYQNAKKQSPIQRFMKAGTIAAAAAVIIMASVIIINNYGKGSVTPPPDTGTAGVVTDVDDPPVIPQGDFKITSVFAEKKVGNFIAGNTAFIVKTENGTTENVRTHLYVSTASEYEVTEIGENSFKVMLAEAVADNSIVSLSYVEDGIIDKSWAFQTETKLSVTEAYPADGTKTAPVNTAIELTFSFASAEGVENAVTFEPELKGVWEHAGKVWRFIPESPLEKDSTYIINIGNGITAEGMELSETSKVTFSTYKESPQFTLNPSIITSDTINTYRPEDNVTIRINNLAEACEDIYKITIDKFDTYNDMILFAEGETVYSARPYGDADFTVEKVIERATNVTFTEKLPQGYYVARAYLENGTHLFDWIIQVHPLSVYAAVTERDILVWAAKDGEVAPDVPVKYLDYTGETGADGTLLMEDVTDGSGKLCYMYVGDGDSPLVMGSTSFSHNNYPKGYLYTDKPKYKCTDTIKVWGMVPTELFYEYPNGKFEVKISSETDTAVEVIPDENGTFECEIKITRHKEDSPNVILSYNGTTVASRWIRIYNYTLKNYEYEFVYDRNYAKQGENLEFGVKMTHISGIPVAGKELCTKVTFVYNVEIDDMYATTDENGIAYFSMTPEVYNKILSSETEYWLGGLGSITVEVKNSNAGESYSNNIRTKFYIDSNYGIGNAVLVDDNKLRVQTFEIDTNGVDIIKTNDKYSETNDLTTLDFCGLPYESTADVKLTVYKTTRSIIDQRYDELSKTYIPVYSGYSDYKEEVAQTYFLRAQTKQGEAIFDLSGYPLPEATETEKYSITAIVTIRIPGLTFAKELTVSYNNFTGPSTTRTAITDNSGIGFSQYTPSNPFLYGTPADYHTYTYALSSDDKSTYNGKITKNYGDSTTFQLKNYMDTPIEGGKLLYFVYSQSIREMNITTESSFDVVFGDTTFPKANVGAVYFKDGVFHRVSKSYLAHFPSDRELDVEITADKEDYAPGETVTVNIKLSADNLIPGATLEGTAVNVSVVNEGVYNNFDSTNITEIIHTGPQIRDYFFSSFRDYSLALVAGGWGDGGGNDPLFSDTAYFGSATADKDGNCTVTFTLPKDKVTAYRITVHAANKDLYSGADYINVEASSDFFIQPGEFKNVKSSDDMVASASLITAKADTAVITFRLNELDMEQTLTVESGKTVFANFGKLPVGEYTVTAIAVSDSDASLTHTITFPVKVETSTLKLSQNHTVDIENAEEIVPASSPVTLRFTTEEGDRYRKYINHSRNVLSMRFDTILGNHYSELMNDVLTNSDVGAARFSAYGYTEYINEHRENRVKLLQNAEDDPVISALYTYLTGENSYAATMPDSTLEAHVLESYLNYAALGSPILSNLLYAKENLSDDPYAHILLSLSFAMLGDTVNAAEVLMPPEENATEGEHALYAMALAFTDRVAAAKELDRLVAEDPTETYLSVATYIYMKNGEKQIGEEKSVTVVCGDREIPITVNGLEEETLVLTTSEGDTVSFRDADENIRLSYSYEADFIPTEDEHNVRGLTVTVPEELTLFRSTEITVDISSVMPETAELLENGGKIKISLPNCFRYDTTAETSQSNIITVNAVKDSSPVVSIPIVVTSPGSYVLEPVIFTCNGVNYYSDATEINIAG